MKIRLPYFDLSPEALAGLRAVGKYLQDSSLGRPLIELGKIGSEKNFR